MKTPKAIMLPLLLAPALIAPAQRTVVNLNDNWQFRMLRTGDIQNNDTTWTFVNLPHDFQTGQPWVEPSPDERPDLDNPMANVKSRLSSRGFKEMGTGLYRKTFTAPEEWKGRRVLLDFEGIMLTGDVCLNGSRIGGTDYGYLGFDIDISDKLRYGTDNVIEVTADTGKPENSRWYTGGGLYRDVNIILTDSDRYFTRHPLHITTPTADASRSVVEVLGEITTLPAQDSIRVGIDIHSPEGETVYSRIRNHWNNRRQHTREFRLDSITLTAAELWDCDNPALYTLTATLYRPDGSVADRVTERFGIRTVEFSPEFGMKLNGKKVLLKGIANHHTLGALGAAAYPRAIEKRIKLLKDFGFNHIRTSHNPYSESFLDLCDEYGILVVDELYDKWLTQYAGGRRDWSGLWQHDVPEWVRRDRNHPSVVMWSLGNELQLIPDLPYNDWGVTPYRLQKDLLRRYDTTRPTTVAMHPRGRDELTDSLPAPLALATDIASYNYRYMYFPGDSRRFPRMMFYQSEASAAGMGPNYYEMDLDRVIGLAYWGMIDYLGESNGWPSKGWSQGVFDISLRPKPQAYFLKSIFKPEEPLVAIGVIGGSDSTVWNDVKVGTTRLDSRWDGVPGSKVALYTFTNADEVELIVNGTSLGRRKNDRSNAKARNRILWEDIEYTPGYIEARGYNDASGKAVATQRLETPCQGIRLTLTGDNPAWKADGIDLLHVDVAAVDSEGRTDHRAGMPVRFEVSGPADIVGVINGDIRSGELTVGDTRSLYNGECSVILRSRREPGLVTIKAIADGLSPAETSIQLH